MIPQPHADGLGPVLTPPYSFRHDWLPLSPITREMTGSRGKGGKTSSSVVGEGGVGIPEQKGEREALPDLHTLALPSRPD